MASSLTYKMFWMFCWWNIDLWCQANGISHTQFTFQNQYGFSTEWIMNQWIRVAREKNSRVDLQALYIFTPWIHNIGLNGRIIVFWRHNHMDISEPKTYLDPCMDIFPANKGCIKWSPPRLGYPTDCSPMPKLKHHYVGVSSSRCLATGRPYTGSSMIYNAR